MIDFKSVIQDILKEFPQGHSIYLGGSYAVGIQNQHSDIDLFMFVNEINQDVLTKSLSFQDTLKSKYSTQFDLLPCHIDYLTHQMPISHSAYYLNRVLLYESKWLWGDDLSNFIKPIENLKLQILEALCGYLVAFLHSEAKRSKTGITYNQIKSGLKLYIGYIILENKELEQDAFHLFYQGLSNPEYFQWKKFSSKLINEVHEVFYTKSKVTLTKKEFFIHSELIKKFLNFQKEFIRECSIKLIKELRDELSKSYPIKLTDNIKASYKEEIEQDTVHDLKLFIYRVEQSLHSYLSILDHI